MCNLSLLPYSLFGSLTWAELLDGIQDFQQPELAFDDITNFTG
jgi:hypothetical protein